MHRLLNHAIETERAYRPVLPGWPFPLQNKPAALTPEDKLKAGLPVF
jgi:hypothetical protein